MPPLNEFDAIRRFLTPLSRVADNGEDGHRQGTNANPEKDPQKYMIGDDAAIIRASNTVASSDAFIETVHFERDDPADAIARKLLRINLSDFAAMGATPRHYLLNLSLPPEFFTDRWLGLFAAGLDKDQRHYGVTLIGGDITRSPHIALSICMIGRMDDHNTPPLRRIGAAKGDLICVSGCLGDARLYRLAATGMAAKKLAPRDHNALKRAYFLPSPRLSLGRRLRGTAPAGMDISDGLINDIGHLCHDLNIGAKPPPPPVGDAENPGSLGADINPAMLPISPAALAFGQEAARNAALIGGEDYELLFAWPEQRRRDLDRIAAEEGLRLTVIGRFTDSGRIRLVDHDGRARAGPKETPWSHF